MSNLRACLIFAFSLSATAFADSAKTVTPQDPLCDTSENFKAEFDRLRPLHLKTPAFRGVATDQARWFTAVTGEMEAICAADKKFAAELLSRDRSALTGQCKPAAEAATYDQLMLEHSEESLTRLKSSREEFLVKGRKGSTDPLGVVFERDRRLVDELSLNRWEVSFDIACELKWLYPAALVKKVPPTTTCKDPASYSNPGEMDKKDAGLFAKLLTRFASSISYNTERVAAARATAAASLARYEACVKEHPGEVLQPIKHMTSAKGSGKPVPSGKSPRKGSDITGVKADEEKRRKAP